MNPRPTLGLPKPDVPLVASVEPADVDAHLGSTSVHERVEKNVDHAGKLLELLKLLESPEEGGGGPLKRLDAVPSLPTSRTDSHIYSARTKRPSPGSSRSDTRDGKRIATSGSPGRPTIVDATRFQQGSLRPAPTRSADIDRPERKVKFDEKPKPLLQRSHAQTTLHKFSFRPESPVSSPTDSPRKPSRLGRLLPRSGSNSPHEGKPPNSSHQSVDQKKTARRASLPDRSRTEGKQTLQDGFVKRINKSLSPRKHGDVDGTELQPKSPARPEETIQRLKAETRFWKDAHDQMLSENDQLKQRVRQLTQQIEILLAEKNEKQ